jgi:hydrogenase maturation protease
MLPDGLPSGTPACPPVSLAALLRRRDLLLLAVGNDRRGDDGLGWAFGRAVEQGGMPAKVEYRYQLQIEDAARVREAGAVLFVDAHAGPLPGGFRLVPLAPAVAFEYTTHVLPPGTVLALCQYLYHRSPEAWLLAITAERFDLGRAQSRAARRGLAAALRAAGVTLETVHVTIDGHVTIA